MDNVLRAIDELILQAETTANRKKASAPYVLAFHEYLKTLREECEAMQSMKVLRPELLSQLVYKLDSGRGVLQQMETTAQAPRAWSPMRSSDDKMLVATLLEETARLFGLIQESTVPKSALDVLFDKARAAQRAGWPFGASVTSPSSSAGSSGGSPGSSIASAASKGTFWRMSALPRQDV